MNEQLSHTANSWPSSVRLMLDGIAQGGEAVGRWGDRVVFVRGGLPGEHVEVALHEQHPSYARGNVLEILQSSPDRLGHYNPLDAHMSWRYIAHTAQLRYKRDILSDQLAKLAGVSNAPIDPTRPSSPQWGYRTSARLHSNGTSIGYYAAESNQLQPLHSDPLLHPTLNSALAALANILEAEPLPFSFEILLRLSETYGYLLATLDGAGDLAMLAARWRMALPAIAGVAITKGPTLVLGADRLVEEVANMALLLRPTSFFQASLAAANTLLELVLDNLQLQGHEHVLDLFCGAGAFTFPIARQSASVIGVESYAGAVADAEESMMINALSNVRFIVAPVERALQQIDQPIDAVVLDPPRRGCHPEALAGLLRLKPERIVYVSCQPATLGRDLRILLAGGYQLQRVTPVDVFPQTPHIESVSLLQRM